MSDDWQSAAQQLDAEVDEMNGRYGHPGVSVENVYFHVTRAKASLDAALLDKDTNRARVQERLTHLEAVCHRFVQAMNGEYTT